VRRRWVLLVLVVAGCKLARRFGADAGHDASIVDAGAQDARSEPDAAPHDAGIDAAAALGRAQSLLEDIRWMCAHRVSMNPSKAGEGDVSSKCDAVESARAKENPPEVARTLEDAEALCAFDVPLLNASEALDHLRFGTSQASKALMCGIAKRELDRARTVRARDARLFALDARRATACK
jgi:hypothetical protein